MTKKRELQLPHPRFLVTAPPLSEGVALNEDDALLLPEGVDGARNVEDGLENMMEIKPIHRIEKGLKKGLEDVWIGFPWGLG